MVIQILGTGCPKCKKLEENAKKALSEINLVCEVVKVTDLNEIMKFGVMMTPGLAINQNVKSVGRVLSPEQIKALILKEGKENG